MSRIVKCCSRCHLMLSIYLFSKDKGRKDGLDTVCKSCRHQYQTSERGRACQHRYSQSEKGKLTKQKWFISSNYKQSEKRKEGWRHYNKSEKGKANFLRYYRSAKGHADCLARAYKYAHSKEGKAWRNEYSRRYEKTDRGRAVRKVINSNRRVLILNRTSNLTTNDWMDILDVFCNRCAYCERSDVKLELDHYIPLSNGGQHIKENIVPACRSCNASKSDRHPHRLF